tara:strand:+ start:620 stop:898 length:279 start_codon:yes stop_codon:yes gene_type:complete
MNKSDLTKKIHNINDLLPVDDIEKSVNLILNYLSETLSNRNRIEIRGFGSFSVRKREERIARNPKTGKTIAVTTKYHPYFRASKDLKEAINN